MRIRKISQPLQPKTNREAKAEEIRMKIANVEQMVENGYITPEEGKVIIENLQAQLAEVQSEQIEEPVSPETLEPETEPIENKTSDYEFGKDDFYSQQADYNKAFFGL